MTGYLNLLRHAFLQVALRHAKAAPTVAMSYLSIVCGLTGGYVLFGEVSNAMRRVRCSRDLYSHHFDSSL